MNNSESQNMMLPKGFVLSKIYRIEDYLSSGGFGNTYVVIHIALNKQMAMKEFFMKGINHREENQSSVGVSNTNNLGLFDAQKEKFRKEARRLEQLDSPNIVKVHDLFDDNGTSYYVMDLIDGHSLETWMNQTNHPFSESQVKSILLQLLSALDVVHKNGMLHMDIKPGNILMDRQGHVILIDFGSSKQIGPGTSTSNTAMSYTPGYAPMEQVNGSSKKWGPWTDYYGLGATLYNLLTNERPPFMDEVLEKQERAFNFHQGISPQMQRLIVWMMSPSYVYRPRVTGAILNFLNMGPAPMANPVPPIPQNESTKLTENDSQQKQQPQQYDAPLQQNETTKYEAQQGGTPHPMKSEETRYMPQKPPVEGAEHKKNYSWLWILVAFLVTVALSLGVYFLFIKPNNHSSSVTPDNPNTPDIQVEDSTEVMRKNMMYELKSSFKETLDEIANLDDEDEIDSIMVAFDEQVEFMKSVDDNIFSATNLDEIEGYKEQLKTAAIKKKQELEEASKKEKPDISYDYQYTLPYIGGDTTAEDDLSGQVYADSFCGAKYGMTLDNFRGYTPQSTYDGCQQIKMKGEYDYLYQFFFSDGYLTGVVMSIDCSDASVAREVLYELDNQLGTSYSNRIKTFSTGNRVSPGCKNGKVYVYYYFPNAPTPDPAPRE